MRRMTEETTARLGGQETSRGMNARAPGGKGSSTCKTTGTIIAAMLTAGADVTDDCGTSACANCRC
jgi:hypothetical protein